MNVLDRRAIKDRELVLSRSDIGVVTLAIEILSTSITHVTMALQDESTHEKDVSGFCTDDLKVRKDLAISQWHEAWVITWLA